MDLTDHRGRRTSTLRRRSKNRRQAEAIDSDASPAEAPIGVEGPPGVGGAGEGAERAVD